MPSSVLGLDIGGANLKAAHSSGVAFLQPFELWKNPAGLARALDALLSLMPRFDLLAITMTGELCDCFETSRQGVHAILDAVEQIVGESAVRVWSNGGRFVEPDGARSNPLQVAAANWLALASFAGRFAPTGTALLVDVGSTTTDIVPLVEGKPAPHGMTDRQRLRSRELVYTGVGRSPLCALLGPACAAELFATTLDAYLVTGEVPEDNTYRGTADGRPATVACAYERLARMLCADRETCSKAELLGLAQRARTIQARMVRAAVLRVAARLPLAPCAVIVAGSGEFLAQRVLDTAPGVGGCRISLREKLGAEISRAACAFAVAVLAAEHAPNGR